MRIERRGNQFTIAVGSPAEELKPLGPVTVNLQDPCMSVSLSVLTMRRYSRPRFSPCNCGAGHGREGAAIRGSKVSLYDLKTNSVSVVYAADQIIEAPVWSPDGKYLLVNSKGDLWKFPVNTPNPDLQKIDLASICRCNNHKGYSPDGKPIAFSSGATGRSFRLYRGLRGRHSKMVVPETPSYFMPFPLMASGLRSWRSGTIISISSSARRGRRAAAVTMSPGYDDGPDSRPMANGSTSIPIVPASGRLANARGSAVPKTSLRSR